MTKTKTLKEKKRDTIISILKTSIASLAIIFTAAYLINKILN